MGANVRDLYDHPTPLYHWSPSGRRKSIERRGLVPSSMSVDRAWKPPYVAYSDSPSMAWVLSGVVHPEVASWDLWMTWSNVPTGLEIMPLDIDREVIKEVRVYERVFKRDLWFVGSRPGIQESPAPHHSLDGRERDE